VRRSGHRSMPVWLRRPIAFTGRMAVTEQRLAQAGLHTVCEEARCPNRGECHARGAATFLILGNICSRQCGFCSVRHGMPAAPDAGEPDRLCDAALGMKLGHIVVTSVTRDDLPDGGAAIFAQTVRLLKMRIPEAAVELLIPDFCGNEAALATVMKSGPDVLGHNIETVARLYPAVRPHASYRRSLELLAKAAGMDDNVVTKSGLMVGLGESAGEVEETLGDLREVGCRSVTIGQYLRPSARQVPITQFVHPSLFGKYEAIGRAMGFTSVVAGPYVRSSYRAGEAMVGNKIGSALRPREVVARRISDGP
jgi:lipoyl synthase